MQCKSPNNDCILILLRSVQEKKKQLQLSSSLAHCHTPITMFSSNTFTTPHPPCLNTFRPSSSFQRRFSIKTLATAGAGGNTGGPGRGNSSTGGSGEGSFWSRLLSPAASALSDEQEPREWDSHGLPANIVVQLNKLSSFKRYRISEIAFFDLVRKANVGKEDSFSEMVRLRAGSVYTKAQLQTELKTLASCGMFEKVEMKGNTKADGSLALTVSFKEKTWPSAEQFRCIAITERLEDDYLRKVENSRPCLLPMTVQRDIVDMLIRNRGTMSARLLRRISHTVHKWYNDEGYLWANVVNLGKLDTEEIVCEVVEGDITKLNIQFLDKFGNVVEGNTRIPVVRRQFPMHFQPGYVYNNEVGKQVLRNLYTLGLFSNVEVKPLPDVGGVVVEVNLTENDHKNVALSTEWNIVPEGREFPILDSVHVGGTVRLNHRNLQGLNRSFHASVTTSNIFKPQDDLSFKFEYEHPYLDGVHNPRDRTLRVSCFNSRKVSPVFTGGTWINNVPPIWVDRAGIKANITEIVFPQFLFWLPGGIEANITENFTRQSKFTYGLVMEEITTPDERRDIRANGLRVLPRGRFSAGGPPTTLSGTGTDRMVFLQTNITCDNTMSVNGTVVGNRSVFQTDQAIGINTQLSFFNRHQLTMTQFIQLRSTEEGAGKPQPPVLVLHGHYGGCVGHLPSYDAFTLGGPYSVRGFRMGEIGAARNILELAAELWIPIKGQYVYVFAEHGNDLGSSEGGQGNRKQVYRPVGHGSSYGVGIKLGIVRAEYAVNLNSGTDAAFLHFGGRF